MCSLSKQPQDRVFPLRTWEADTYVVVPQSQMNFCHARRRPSGLCRISYSGVAVRFPYLVPTGTSLGDDLGLPMVTMVQTPKLSGHHRRA